MSNYTVGAGGDFATLSAASKAVKPGDVVDVLPGTYKERLTCDVAGVTWRGQPGAVIDGGYSFEWARKSGDSWRNLVYRTPLSTMGDGVLVKADNVTLDGLTVRNSGDVGIAVGPQSNIVIRNCDIEHSYRGAITVNGGKGEATDILIEDNYCNIAAVVGFDPNRSLATSPQGVSGVLKIGNCRRVTVRRNVVSRGFGEGINVDKGSRDSLVEDNLIHDCAHLHIYANHAAQALIRRNVIFCGGSPAQIGKGGTAPAGIGIRDEKTQKGGLPASRDVTFEDNLVVNMGYPLLINADPGGGGFVVKGNTFVWGPMTLRGVTIVGKQPGEFTDNLLYVADGAPATGNTPQGMAFSGNHWTVRPPAAFRGSGDTYGPLGLASPNVVPTSEYDEYGMGRGDVFDVSNYRPPVDPDDPPVDPPPPDPEPGLDVTALLALVDAAAARLDTADGELALAAASLVRASQSLASAVREIEELRQALGEFANG